MAYTPINWQTGDTITAEKMNKMDNGWSVGTSAAELFSETVTTIDDGGIAWGDFSYSQAVTADSLTITFNGTPYECPRMTDGEVSLYGGWVEDGSEFAPDFSVYPFAYVSEQGANNIATENAGTYTFKAEMINTSTETSSEFQSAVKSVVDANAIPMLCISGVTTSAEIRNAVSSGRFSYFYDVDGIFYFITRFAFTSNVDATVSYYPNNTGAIASVVNGVFIVTKS